MSFVLEKFNDIFVILENFYFIFVKKSKKLSIMESVHLYWEKEIKPQLDPLHDAAGNLMYYVFQTPYRFQPELLIVGINPGGDFKDGVPFLERENNWYTKDKQHSFSGTLCKVFGYGKNDKLFDMLDNAVGTNMTFFNTGNVNSLKNNALSSEMRSRCVEIARNLVDNFIQPKRILCLGVPPFDGMKDKTAPIEYPIKGIRKSYRGDTPVYYIPNPSKININKYYKNESQIAQYQQYFEQEFLNQ